jgi:tRNA C32,U32 (ribose-2'-O)-methylase TrmJ
MTDEIMALIDAYAEARHVGGCYTYNAKTAEARAKVVEAFKVVEGEPLKDHQIAELINELRDVAKKYSDTQQLRERIAHILVPVLRNLQSRNRILSYNNTTLRTLLKAALPPLKAMLPPAEKEQP